MQVCGNVQTIQCFHYNKDKNPEVDDMSIRALSVQPGPCNVPAAYDPSTKIVTLAVNVTELFTQNRGLALARRAATSITCERSTVPGYEGLFEHARRLYLCECIVFVSVYTECKNQFLATVPLHLGGDGVVRALLPWNGYCYEEGTSALTKRQVCVCCLDTHIHYLQGSTCTGAPLGDVDTKTYEGAMRSCLAMLSVFGTIDRRQLLLNSCKEVLSVFDSPERSMCTDDTGHADVLTYSSIALIGLLPVGIVHRAMTQPAMHPRLAQALLRDVCALFAARCVLTGNDAELFASLLVWNLHRLQADVQTYRREQGEDQRRMLALRSRERMYMVGDCEDLASFLLQLVGTIFSVQQLRQQVPPHVRIGPSERNILLPARGFFRTEVHAFPVQVELCASGCMMRVIEATRPVFCFDTPDARDRAQKALGALPGSDCIQYTLAAQQRDCYTVWFLGECMVFVLGHGGGRRAVLEHMAKPRTAYAGPLRLDRSKDTARIHALARAGGAKRTQTLVLIPEHVFFYAYAELVQYAPGAAQARLSPEVAALVLPIARHIELQQSFGDLLCALFSESQQAHLLLADNLERKLGQCPAPLQPLACALRVPRPNCPPPGPLCTDLAQPGPVCTGPKLASVLLVDSCTNTDQAPGSCPPPGPLCTDLAQAGALRPAYVPLGPLGAPPGPLCTGPKLASVLLVNPCKNTDQAPGSCPPPGPLCTDLAQPGALRPAYVPPGPVLAGPGLAKVALVDPCKNTDQAPGSCPPPGPLCTDLAQPGALRPAYVPLAPLGAPPGPVCTGPKLAKVALVDSCTNTDQAPGSCPPPGPCALQTSASRIPPLTQPVRDVLLKLHARLWNVQCFLCYYLHHAHDTERPAELCPCVVAHARDIQMHRAHFVGWYGKFLCPFFDYFARVCSEQPAGADGCSCACARLDSFCIRLAGFMQCVQALLTRAPELLCRAHLQAGT